MGKNTNKIVSVKNHQNKTDVKEIKLVETHQRLVNNNLVFDESQNPNFMNLCKDKVAKGCDKKNMQIFKGITEKGW